MFFSFLGKIYHLLGTVDNAPGEKRKFCQIYFHDSGLEQELDDRMGVAAPGLNKNVMRSLQCLINKHNPLAKTFKSMGSIDPSIVAKKKFVFLKNYKPSNSHNKTYSLPETNEISIIDFSDSTGMSDILCQLLYSIAF